MTEWRDEVLRLLKGSPQPEVGEQTIAQRLGVEPRDLAPILEQLEAEGTIRREPGRIVVVEPAASRAPDGRAIP